MITKRDLFSVAAASVALACSGMPAANGSSCFELSLASFMSLQTEAREMPCFLATCVKLNPERRS